jgi:hypothetical protein
MPAQRNRLLDRVPSVTAGIVKVRQTSPARIARRQVRRANFMLATVARRSLSCVAHVVIRGGECLVTGVTDRSAARRRIAGRNYVGPAMRSSIAQKLNITRFPGFS